MTTQPEQILEDNLVKQLAGMSYVKEFNEAFVQLIQIAPSVNSVTQLEDEEEELKFVKTFRNLIRPPTGFPI
jgi:hypothetical protein